jgi:hypothetical protein
MNRTGISGERRQWPLSLLIEHSPMERLAPSSNLAEFSTQVYRFGTLSAGVGRQSQRLGSAEILVSLS